MRPLLWLPCLALLASPGAHAADLFNLDQRYGSIDFSVRHFGAFSSLGSFPRFMAKLLIDRVHPENTRIDVEADATSVTVPWADGTSLLRGPEFFDIARYPEVRFYSESVKSIDPQHFEVDGTLEMRGVRHPLTLNATLEHESTDPSQDKDIADFLVTGTLSRSDYGMTAEPIMISNQVKLRISARIELPARHK